MKVKFLKIFLTIMTLNVFFSACESPLSQPPMLPRDGNATGGRTAGSPPLNVTATHGRKRSIELKWDEAPGAVRYHIYQSDSPLNPFEQCAETSATQYNFNIEAGSTVYYRVSAIAYNGEESERSLYVKGTSLAQPLITDITDVTEESAVVTWYMENVEDATYRANLLYTVYCYEGSAEKAQIALDGAALSENKAAFVNLSANTQYRYEVEAYLRGDQYSTEKSGRVDAATARRMRPGAPVNMKAARGTSRNKIELSFDLPDMVDIALGENQFEPKKVYFVISKRRYSASGTNEYTKVHEYKIGNYIPGVNVKWTDEIASNSRGIEYEYQVQSYVDETSKIITADSSRASARGWALSEGRLAFGKLDYELNEAGTLYKSAQLPLVFEFDPKGEIYDYSLVEKIEPIDALDLDPDLDPDVPVKRTRDKFTYNDIKNYVAQMNLTQKTTESTPGRGVYSYDVEIKLNGNTIDTVSTIGKVNVSDNTEPIDVEEFSVRDGYKDKFVFKWKNQKNRRYILYMSNDGQTGWTPIHTVNPNPVDTDTGVDEDYSYTYTENITPGITKYFAIQPSRNIGNGSFKSGQMVYPDTAFQTLGVPELSLAPEASYSLITATWTEAQKADAYRIKYWYVDDGPQTAVTRETVSKDDLTIDASGKFKYAFIPFVNNTVDINKAGKEIRVAVDALNTGLHAEVGGGEIAVSSQELAQTRLVGPALLDPRASHAAAPMDIDVSWHKITGANGYYVFRRQFNMNNTAEEGDEAVVYYVPASESPVIDVTGKDLALDSSNAKGDTTTVKATASFTNSRYTLKDAYLTDGEYDGAYQNHVSVYRDQQNNMAQGYSYRYYIVPVVNRSGSPEPFTSIEFTYAKDGSNKNTNINYYTIRENGVDIRYNGASAFEKEGFTIGFGQNVTATKGTYASSGNVNNGIHISWSAPPRLASVAGFSPRYTVYRRESGGSAWDTLTGNIEATQYVDTPQTRGVAYEYVVGISGSQPKDSRRFLERCGTLRDERNRPNYLGYMLDMVKMVSVSRDERKGANGNFGEQVNWYSAGITNTYSADNNWGIDGYTIYVMNRNINASWHEITDISSNIPNQLNQSVVVTAGMGSVTLSTTAGNMPFDMLRVMRDYKHYFKVRSYVLNGDQKIYCPDPSYTWSNGGQNDYVKWGARQVTTNEFITIALLYLADGIDQINGTAWNTAYFGRSANANGTGTSGSVEVSSNFGVTSWDFQFKNYKTDLQLRTGDWVTFVTINGKIWAGTNASNQYPQRWGDLGYFDVIGPSDTPGLYTGRMKIGNPEDLYWDRGKVYVYYPSSASLQTINYRGEDTPLLYSGKGDRRYNLEHFR